MKCKKCVNAHVSFCLVSRDIIVYVQARRLSKVWVVSGSETIRVLIITEIVPFVLAYAFSTIFLWQFTLDLPNQNYLRDIFFLLRMAYV